MSIKPLGEFEELVLTFVAILGDQAYGNSIIEAVKEQLGRTINLSATHITLYRLEDKGLVKSTMGGATTTRGGRRKRLFQITNAGKTRLLAMQEQRRILWKLLPEFKFTAR
ncbi:MAG: PadR family transcriptional regulator [Saprospiraceae bacterium]|nr:PadR family transcriptional regulator [Saprospiraceae bacterium]